MAQQKAVEAPIEDADDLVDELQPGTKLLKGQYTIVRYINSGGFGITYLAKDSLDRDVVIKECFPSSFCRRSKTMVTARSRAHTAELRSVIQLFVREARHLSKIVHPNIVAVHQVFEDNGTAYMAIDFINGLDLQQIIDGQGPMPQAEEIVLMTEKLLAAVGFIHSNDMLHRDISPDNVLIDQKGQPILIDFGAAREHASQTGRAMSALRVVKDGYSPQEFYIAGSEQGPWSDLYALGATLYHLISGEAPVNGQARLAALAEDQPDPYTPLVGRFEGYPPGFLAAIDKALSTLPKQRVQTAQEWLAMFRPGVHLPIDPNDDIAAAVQAMVANARAEAATRIEAQGAAAAAAEFGGPPKLARQVSQPQPKAADAQAKPAAAAQTKLAPEAGSTRRSGMTVQLVGGVAAALAVVGLGLILLGG
ncbi:MAG: serine/threonine protein kinase, partial [Rhodobacterales bacterium]